MLAQCDSCIGAKTSLNYKGFKNLLGTFYPPASVQIQPLFLLTQSEADYLSGVGELVKLHLIGGESATAGLATQYSQLLKRDTAVTLGLIRASLLIKKAFIEEDELDAGRRNLLNFGHCFGHAWETATDYAVPHGQAVVAGIVLAQRVAVRRGLMSMDKAARLNDTLLNPLLKGFSWQVDTARVIEAMSKDKKRTGTGLALVMMKDGHEMVRVNDLTEKEAREALEALS
jgi:3-dehydroquinate synthase